MKKRSVTLIILFAIAIHSFGQDVNSVLSKLSKEKNVERISIGSFGMFFVKMVGGMAGGSELWQGLKGIKSLEVLTWSEGYSAVEKEHIREMLHNLKDDKEYATLMTIKDEGEYVRFLIKQEKEVIKEVIIIALEEDDDSVVLRLKGSFRESDLTDLVDKSGKKGNGR